MQEAQVLWRKKVTESRELFRKRIVTFDEQQSTDSPVHDRLHRRGEERVPEVIVKY
jgi:hypothetical protein